MKRAPTRAVLAAIATGWLLVTTIAAPCAWAATPRVRIDIRGIDGDRRKNVKGTLSIAKKALRKQASEGYLRHLHERAEGEIKRALEPFGYYRVHVTSELITGRAWTARYTIDPGPAIRLDTVRVEVVGAGSADPLFRDRVAQFPLRHGDVLEHAKYDAGKATFETAAAQGGYVDATFLASRIHVDLQRYVASIELRVDTGERHHFGETLFEETVVDSSMVARFVNYKPGDVLDYRKLLELQTDLSKTGYFSRVEVELRRDLEHDTWVPIDVALAPAKRERYTGGVGYGTDDGARLRTTIEMRRLNAHGHRAQIDGQYAQLEKSIIGLYRVPWPNPRTDLVSWGAGYQDLRTDVAHSGLLHGGVTAARRLGIWEAAVALNYRRETFTVGPDLGTVDFLIPEGTWSRLRTDNVVDTRGGDRMRLNLRGGHDVLLSDVSFLQGQAEAKVIVPLGPGNRALGRLQAGTTAAEGFRRLPPTLRFFAGGANSVRGYRYNSLGPRDVSGQVIGGRHLLAASVEVDRRILPRWGVAAFFDYGNALNALGDELKRGVGAGLRWYSPFGLVRADAAWGLDRAGRPVELHLQVGPEL